MNEAQVWAVIAISGAAVLLVVVERLLARMVKLWAVEAALRTVRPLFRSLAASSKGVAGISETPHLHREAPKVTSWRRGPHGPGCRCRGVVVQA